MSLPEESVAVNTLPEVTTIPTGKKLIFTDPDTNEGGIITLENLTKQILQNLTSQTFALDQGNLTLLQALNQLNSKTSIQHINNVLPDSLRTGLYAGIYDVGSENAPSDYGTVMYLSYTYDTNKWYTAIASATNNEGVFVSTKTNGADWNGWRKLSTN
jgi:hypothetical protein|nr:MAG TPA: hypothetical protein [Caudoviricetes sp.]